MEINTNTNFEPLNDHPPIQDLSKKEQGLYWSALKGLTEVVETIEEYQEQYGEVDFDDPELKHISEKVQTTIALSEVLEEIAAWRRSGIRTDAGRTAPPLDIEFDPVDSHNEESKDE